MAENSINIVKQNGSSENVSIDYEAWTEFFSYYRYYVDEFAVDILGLELFPFQRVILRALARGQFSVLIACRGLGRLYHDIKIKFQISKFKREYYNKEGK